MTPNRYLLLYNKFNIELTNWVLIEYKPFKYYIKGVLENKNKWKTSTLKKIIYYDTHLYCVTKNNSIYQLFFD
tara:strand:- start:471 stop:689 length:219 start_codon:yes stop_codon:yes gene_type:complete